MTEYVCQGFAPIIPAQPKLMILGTMPSVQSLADAFYYAHPRNAFWPILAEIFQQPISSIEDKQQLCLQQGILLWDVLQTCVRSGSLDSAIQQPVANDFGSLFKRFPNLKQVCFNGQKAGSLFKTQVMKEQNLPSYLEFRTLPSTSPANARMAYQDKLIIWQQTLR